MATKVKGIFIGDCAMLGAYTIEFPEDREDARAPTVPIKYVDRLTRSRLVVQIHGNAWPGLLRRIANDNII